MICSIICCISPFVNALYRVILQIVCTILSDKNKLAFVRKAFNIILYPVSSIIRSCSGNS